MFALLLQKYAGAIAISHSYACIITGLVSGMVASLVDFETKKSLYFNH
jgi:hypothetical protein